MSRQIRRQIPQKQKKKRVDRNACLLVFILIFSGILTFLLLTARDNSKLNSTLDETFGFVKNRIESYEIYNTNDQVKSLVRLLDKTTELSRVIELVLILVVLIGLTIVFKKQINTLLENIFKQINTKTKEVY